MIQPISGQDQNQSTANQVLIRFSPKTTPKAIKKIHSHIKAVVIEENNFLGFQIISSAKSVDDMIKYYKSLKGIEYVKPNYKVQIT